MISVLFSIGSNLIGAILASRDRISVVLRNFLARPSGKIGLSLVAFHIVLALISPWIAPYDYREMNANQILAPPSTTHWLGTDHLGRDVFSRVLMGGRQALIVTGLAAPLAIVWGGFVGIFFGLIGGRLDEILMRLVDAFLSLPWILKMLVLIVMLGTRLDVLIPALAFIYGVPVIRIARAATHDVVARDFVSAARARGHSQLNIIYRELLPNVLNTLMVEGAMRWSWMLLAFASLSFLGFGVSPPTPDWSVMIADARGFVAFAPWAVLGPIIALSSLIIGINLAADALAKALGIDRAQRAPL